jgi:hypothetical protein
LEAYNGRTHVIGSFARQRKPHECAPNPEVPAMRFVVLVFVAFILFSLFSALYFLLKDKGQSTRTVKALTVRVVLSILLFVLLLLGFKFGLITQRL